MGTRRLENLALVNRAMGLVNPTIYYHTRRENPTVDLKVAIGGGVSWQKRMKSFLLLRLS